MSIISLVIFFLTFTTIKSKLSCEKFPSCICRSEDNNIVRYECYHNNVKKFIVTVKPEDLLMIECTDWDGWENFNVKSSRSGKIFKTVNFQNCGISKNIKLIDVINRLGVEETDNLIFNSYKNYSETLKSEDFEGFYNITSFDLSFNGLIDIISLRFWDILKIERINLSNNAINIPRYFFEYARMVKRVDISNNELNKIIDGLFYRLYYLEYLDLHGNRLEDFEVGTFMDLHSLKYLNISHNRLKRWSEINFNELSQLEVLDLSFNSISYLPLYNVEEHKKLRELYFHNNTKEVSTPISVFLKFLHKLQIVYLNNNDITFIYENTFWESRMLTYINLDDNSITQLHNQTFLHQANVVELSIRNNFIKALPDRIFKEMSNLDKLDLSGNKITSITSGIFEGLAFLMELNMERNQISYIEETALSKMPGLKIAKFSHNKLKFQSSNNWYSLRNNIFLREFHLSYNGIRNLINEWTKHAHFLRFLDLSHNKIKNIGATEIIYPSSEFVIDLTFNKIKNIFFYEQEKLKEYFTENHKIDVLMDHNPILCDCHLFNLLRLLENSWPNFYFEHFKISLGNLSCINYDQSVGPAIENLNSATYTCFEEKYFNISNSCQNDCDCRVRLYDKSRILDCSYKKMSKFLIDSRRVKPIPGYSLIVNLTGNSLTEIPSLKKLESMNVTELLLSNNNISQMTIEVLPETLKVLELHNNNISEYKMHDIFYMYCGVLNKFTLSGNPIKCDCNIKELLHLIKEKRYLYRDLEKLKCGDLPMYEMTVDMLKCPNIHGWTVVSYIIWIFLSFIIVVIVIDWVHRKVYGISIKDRFMGFVSRTLFPWRGLII